MNKGRKKTIILLSFAVLGMWTFSWALIPLYDAFCEVTGLNGKVTQSSSAESSMTAEGREIGLQFISHNNAGMPWVFKPSQRALKIKTGVLHEATFYAKNTTNKTMIGRAVNSIAPSNAKNYVKKIECFCFEEGIELKPGEEIYLPIKMVLDNELPKEIKNIVLSYTIFDSNIKHNLIMDHDSNHEMEPLL
jgi:cytochrome c oxidase assembly protein subunit 11